MAGDSYSITDQNEMHFTTFTVVDWMDVFIRHRYKLIVVEGLNYCIKNKGLEVYAWCLMTSHMHLIIRAKEGYQLSNIIRDFKKNIATKIILSIEKAPESRREWMLERMINAGKKDARITKFKFFQESNHSVILYNHSPNIFDQKLDYIHNNPVEEGIVEYPEEYLFSSARDYAGKKGLVEISGLQ